MCLHAQYGFSWLTLGTQNGKNTAGTIQIRRQLFLGKEWCFSSGWHSNIRLEMKRDKLCWQLNSSTIWAWFFCEYSSITSLKSTWLQSVELEYYCCDGQKNICKTASDSFTAESKFRGLSAKAGSVRQLCEEISWSFFAYLFVCSAVSFQRAWEQFLGEKKKKPSDFQIFHYKS